MSIIRGCGSRQKGAVYAEVLTSPYGFQLEHFLVDPPVKIDAAALGLSSIGVKIIESNMSKDGTANHVWDIVGERHYLNVCDVIEEGRRFGFSRRLPRTLNFSLLNERSRLILLHPRAWIENHYDYTVNPAGMGECPKRLSQHDPWNDNATSVMCCGLWWEDIEGGKSVTADCTRLIEREMPSFKYSAYCREFKFNAEGHKVYTVTPEYSLAIFASFPISRIVVIRDNEAGEHEQAYEKAQQANLPVEIVDE